MNAGVGGRLQDAVVVGEVDMDGRRGVEVGGQGGLYFFCFALWMYIVGMVSARQVRRRKRGIGLLLLSSFLELRILGSSTDVASISDLVP